MVAVTAEPRRPPPRERAPREAEGPLGRTTSEALLQGRRKILILHDGEAYTLQVTRQNKLLLTK